GSAGFAGMGVDKTAAAADLGAELKAIDAVEGPAIKEANAIISLETSLGALKTKTTSFEVRASRFLNVLLLDFLDNTNSVFFIFLVAIAIH
ncbi:hypothetical protein C0995_007136, partial [Termitomyces sp. Mi166